MPWDEHGEGVRVVGVGVRYTMRSGGVGETGSPLARVSSFPAALFGPRALYQGITSRCNSFVTISPYCNVTTGNAFQLGWMLAGQHSAKMTTSDP